MDYFYILMKTPRQFRVVRKGIDLKEDCKKRLTLERLKTYPKSRNKIIYIKFTIWT